jgi:hypothetical protein
MYFMLAAVVVVFIALQSKAVLVGQAVAARVKKEVRIRLLVQRIQVVAGAGLVKPQILPQPVDRVS